MASPSWGREQLHRRLDDLRGVALLDPTLLRRGEARREAHELLHAGEHGAPLVDAALEGRPPRVIAELEERVAELLLEDLRVEVERVQHVVQLVRDLRLDRARRAGRHLAEQLPLELAHEAPLAGELHARVQHLEQLLVLEGLGEVAVHGAAVDGVDGRLHVRVGREDHPERPRVAPAHALAEGDAGHAGHALVRQEDRGLEPLRELLERLLAGGGGDEVEVVLEDVGEGHAVGGLVVDVEDRRARLRAAHGRPPPRTYSPLSSTASLRGSSSRKAAPTAGRSASSWPPLASAR